MKAVYVRETGDASVLSVENDVPIPELKDGQVLVRNEFAGLNFIDTYHRTGLYPRPLPFVAGLEGAGVVEKITPAAAEFGIKEGDRVTYTAPSAYAQFTAVEASKIIPVPDGVGLDVAITLVVQGLTAHYLTVSAHADLIKPNEWMLIHAIGGGTGQWAAQMAKIKGYKVVGVTSQSKAQKAEELGVDKLIVLDQAPGKSHADYSDTDALLESIMIATDGEGVKCALDGVGRATWEVSLSSLALRGICVFFGNASGPVPDIPPFKLSQKSTFITRCKLGDYTSTREELLWRASEVFEWYQSGQLKVNIDQVFELDQVSDGHRYMEEGRTTGKVLFKC